MRTYLFQLSYLLLYVLSNHNHLFVLHDGIPLHIVHDSPDVILDFGLRSISVPWILIIEASRELRGKCESEWDNEVSRLKHASRKDKAWILGVHDCFVTLSLVVVIAYSLDEADLFCSFHFEFHIGSWHWLYNSDIDASSDCVSWMIEGLCGLHHHIACIVFAA